MFGSVVIDVVIAMALVFTLFSLVTSGLREVVAWLAKTRSKELWHSVRDLLEDPISNALRPLREAIAGQSGEAAAQNATTVDEAEHRLRDARDEETTPDKWAAAVDTNVATLKDELVGLSDAAGLVSDAETRPDPARTGIGLHDARQDADQRGLP